MMVYRMPAEWEKHEATWLSWPVNTVTWPVKHLADVQAIYLRMMQALLDGEKVHLLVPDEKTGRKVLAELEAKKAKTARLILHRVPTVDAWIRDYGPIFVKKISVGRGAWGVGRDEQVFTKWQFNAWGGKYKDLAKDNGVVGRIAHLKHFRRIDVPMVLEGGSIDVNGRGTLLTTEQCLLNKNRNPKFSRIDIEARLRRFLGAKKVIWLKAGIEADDTDGHVDDVTRFVSADTVLTAVESDTSKPNHGPLSENLRILREEKDAMGRKLQVLELPMPDAGAVPASYANFYIGNGVVLLPVYNDPNDAVAKKILRKAFPRRMVVAIDCSALVKGLGSIHCVTQQQPL